MSADKTDYDKMQVLNYVETPRYSVLLGRYIGYRFCTHYGGLARRRLRRAEHTQMNWFCFGSLRELNFYLFSTGIAPKILLLLAGIKFTTPRENAFEETISFEIMAI